MLPKPIFLVAALFCISAARSVPADTVLVNDDWVQTHLNDPDIVLVDMSDDDTQYERFHLPGAVRLPYYALLYKRKKSDRYFTRIGDEAFVRLLGRLGISRKNYVVIYDDVGGLNAGRLFWHLEHIGHPKVSVLDGGLVQWILQGRKVINTPAVRKPVSYGPLEKGRDNEAVLEQVRMASQTGEALLLDVRTAEEYIGNVKKGVGGMFPAPVGGCGNKLWTIKTVSS